MAKLQRFEECGAIFTDRLNNIKDLKDRGFVVSNVVVGDSPFGSACVFNGVDSIIDTGSDWLPLGDLTISVWINPSGTDVTAAGRILDNGSLFVYFIKTQMKIGILSSNKTLAVSDINSIELNKWQHIVATRKSDGTTKIYINGVDKSIAVSSETPIVGTSNVIIGNRDAMDRGWGGLISNLIVWNKILSTDEIVSLYKSQVFDYEKNVIADFDMSSVNPVNNSFRSSGGSGVGSNVVVKSDWITGLEFNGVDSVIDTGSDWLPLGDLSVSVWIKPYSFGENTLGRIIDNGNSFINLYDAGLRVEYRISGNSQVYSSNIIETNKWQHIVVTSTSAGIVNFYINGELSGLPDQNAGVNIVGSTNVMIGNNAGLTRTFDGLISKLKVFDCALTSLQVKDLYNKELGGRR